METLPNDFAGVGVDIRVHHSVNIGLSATAEDFFQEGGRPMRGSPSETKGKQGWSFFLQKGVLGKSTTRSSKKT